MQTFITILPELFLAVTASLLLGFGLSKTKDRSSLVRYIAIGVLVIFAFLGFIFCLLYTSPSPRDRQKSRMPSSA